MDNRAKWIVRASEGVAERSAGAPSRRLFLELSGSAAGAAWLARFAPLIAAAQGCAREAQHNGGPFTMLTEREGADLDAFAARIIPTDDTPGAREAGAVYFADQALATFMADLLPIVRDGLARLAERVAADGRAFADLDEPRQDDVIAAVEREDPGFFFLARSLVVLGCVSDPSHGGNRDGLGWGMIGFEDDFAYQPPFGYYDSDEHGAGA